MGARVPPWGPEGPLEVGSGAGLEEGGPGVAYLARFLEGNPEERSKRARATEGNWNPLGKRSGGDTPDQVTRHWRKDKLIKVANSFMEMLISYDRN